MRLAVVGAGRQAVDYLKSWARLPGVTFPAVVDVSADARRQAAAQITGAGQPAPREFDSLQGLLDQARGLVDAVYISTPHVFHGAQAAAATRAGLDVLLEKPMTTSVAEAEQLAQAARASGRAVVVAFQGALSPLVRDTRLRAAQGEFGRLAGISASVWENWASQYAGHWKQVPAMAGGGFMFDTGAHMMNTVALMTDSEFSRLSAYMNRRDKAVEVLAAVAGRLASGALFTLHAIGEAAPGCRSHISLFFSRATVRIDAWGAWREIDTGDRGVQREEADTINNPLEAFMEIRAGRLDNLSTVDGGIRFAKLWQAIQLSADGDGIPIDVNPSAGGSE